MSGATSSIARPAVRRVGLARARQRHDDGDLVLEPGHAQALREVGRVHPDILDLALGDPHGERCPGVTGTALAGIRLMERAGARIIGCSFVIDLPEIVAPLRGQPEASISYWTAVSQSGRSRAAGTRSAAVPLSVVSVLPPNTRASLRMRYPTERGPILPVSVSMIQICRRPLRSRRIGGRRHGRWPGWPRDGSGTPWSRGSKPALSA